MEDGMRIKVNQQIIFTLSQKVFLKFEFEDITVRT